MWSKEESKPKRVWPGRQLVQDAGPCSGLQWDLCILHLIIIEKNGYTAEQLLPHGGSS